MSVCAESARIVKRASQRLSLPATDLPLFLLPSFIGISRARYHRRQLYTTSSQAPRSSSSLLYAPEVPRSALSNSPSSIRPLQQQCSGCGALSQTADKDQAGYYNIKRKSVNIYLHGGSTKKSSEEDAIVARSLQAASATDPGILAQLSLPETTTDSDILRAIEPPLCDRCHNIKNHDTGVSIQHPSIHSIQETIFQSPYKINHVYHVVDAADFPMSLIPGLHRLLNITPQRSLNRRSKTGRFHHGVKTEISFIITRSDLLAPKKEQVDSMMAYLQSVLRDALGRAGRNVRLGNVHCVSAKRGWWTKQLKEEIWQRGGGGWMVGKVNVGKSQLFGEIFPKGTTSNTLPERPRSSTMATAIHSLGAATDNAKEGHRNDDIVLSMDNYNVETPEATSTDLTYESDVKSNFIPMKDNQNLNALDYLEREEERLKALEEKYLDSDSLLPPPQAETQYPEMPLVSPLPGTTASPIRVPFGNGRGELIDLPGLARGDLELHVKPEERSSLIMRSRIRPERQTLKPGQSLLLGGFIRITPTTPDVIFLATAFNPLPVHRTSTDRAIGTQTQTREANVPNISLPGTGEKIASAGTFYLKWDVTKQYTGSVTARDAAKVKVQSLPYRVMAADILIESVGWVEITAQIRKPPGTMFGKEEKKDELETLEEDHEEEIDPEWPSVEVFSPEGKFIGVRRPMNAWLNFAQKPSEKGKKARPRKSMKGAKKNAKARARSSGFAR